MDIPTLTEATLLLNDSFRKGTYGNNGASTPEIERYNLHKLRHSMGVLEIGRQIMLGKEFIELNTDLKRKAELSFLLHDLGRFFQNDGNNVLKNEEFEHGDVSADIVSSYGYSNDIVLAIKYHNKKDTSSIFNEEYFTEMNTLEQSHTFFLMSILRDADKLQNLLYILFSFENIYKIDYNNYDGDGLTEKVLKDFLDFNLIDNKDRKTKADYLLSMLAWGYDLEFITTYEILERNNFFDFIINQLAELNIEEDIIFKIRKNVSQIKVLIKNK